LKASFIVRASPTLPTLCIWSPRVPTYT
jgi:hypothetical protein